MRSFSAIPRLAFLAPALFSACMVMDKVAGGSSEVDNPVITVAFIDSLGDPVATTGSVSVYLADQNPTLDPDPLLKKQVQGSTSLQLSARDFTQGLDSTRSYNLLLIEDGDTTGALVQNLTYNPALGRYTHDSSQVEKINAHRVHLIRYEASLDAPNDTGLVRIIIPGTPFQSVVVDSTFILDGVPDAAFPLYVLTHDGQELPLKPDRGNPQGGHPHHQIDSGRPPIVRPSPGPTHEEIHVDAGEDASLIASTSAEGTNYSLLGTVSGIDPQDPRLSVIWRQLSGSQGAKAKINKPSSLNTHVVFPRSGVYKFVLSAIAGAQKAEDTVLISVQTPSDKPVFVDPGAGDTAFIGEPFDVFWEGRKPEFFWLEISYDQGFSWFPIAMAPVQSQPGNNRYTWVPQGMPADQVMLRLSDMNGVAAATSAAFLLRNRSSAP
jgi:hypothetical protein